MTLSRDSRLKGALFGVAPGMTHATGAPTMTGFLESATGRIPVAAFERQARISGRQYLNLKIGERGPEVLFGKLFPQSAYARGSESSGAAVPGHSSPGPDRPQFSGYVKLTGKENGHALRIAAWFVMGQRQRYLSLVVEPDLRRLAIASLGEPA